MTWERPHDPRHADRRDCDTPRPVPNREARRPEGDQLPEGAAQPRNTDSSLVKALARAFRWKRMLESGDFATIAELADREGIASSFMTRVLRLTLHAPNLVEAILDMGDRGRT